MNFAALPPEINSIKMYSGPGPGSLLVAAAAWDGMAAELHSAATAYQATITRLAAGSWTGPSAQAMAAAATPYVSWLASTAARAAETATRLRAAAAAYEDAFAMTVPPSVVAANRAQLMMLVATNVLGQNTAAIAATEAHYTEMWAQDAAAMDGYAVASARAAAPPPFPPAPRTANPAGPSEQAAAVAQHVVDSAATGTAGIQAALTQVAPATTGVPLQAALPAQGVLEAFLGIPSLADIIGADVTSSIGIGVSGMAWSSADASTLEILHSQDQLQVVSYDILHAIDLFSPLTPSRPEGYLPGPPGALSAVRSAMGEAVSVGRFSVPMSWAANAPEIRSLAYTAPTAGASVAPTVVSAAPMAPGAPALAGPAGTAFSQMALAGMGGSALAGAVQGNHQQNGETPGGKTSRTQPQSPANGPETGSPVTGIAAEIREFAQLRDSGLITAQEYDDQKRRLLGR